MDRRAFMVACGAVPFTAACASFQYVPGRLDAGRIVVAKSELAGKSYALVEIPSLNFPIYLHHAGGDSYTAVLTRCMHRGCTVEPADSHLVCPCHGSEYSHGGEVLKGPTELPLIRFPVTTDAEHIYIMDVGGGAR